MSRLPHPIFLYRRILRLHRQLPTDFRQLGDAHVRDEFHHHRTTTDPQFLEQFLSQWSQYADTLQEQLSSGADLGKSLGEDRVKKLDADKTQRLWELRKEARGQGDIP
ncbi:MAG: hypothetical protein DHS80DRAFT_11589 [Piptocephalis tieghemiana]|nr:MAG: hypothetical protein DHS80DRAFT_11589 [Piptocephalis tieghemiana]